MRYKNINKIVWQSKSSSNVDRMEKIAGIIFNTFWFTHYIVMPMNSFVETTLFTAFWKNVKYEGHSINNRNNILKLVYEGSYIKYKGCHFSTEPPSFSIHLVQRST
jgi:hypothetical protein